MRQVEWVLVRSFFLIILLQLVDVQARKTLRNHSVPAPQHTASAERARADLCRCHSVGCDVAAQDYSNTAQPVGHV